MAPNTVELGALSVHSEYLKVHMFVALSCSTVYQCVDYMQMLVISCTHGIFPRPWKLWMAVQAPLMLSRPWGLHFSAGAWRTLMYMHYVPDIYLCAVYIHGKMSICGFHWHLLGVLFSSLARWVFYLVWHFTKKYKRGHEDMLVIHDLTQIFNWLEIPPQEVNFRQKKGHPMVGLSIYLFICWFTGISCYPG